jgi:hypothetical protein
MPTSPVVEYLARSLSAFYAIMGAGFGCVDGGERIRSRYGTPDAIS